MKGASHQSVMLKEVLEAVGPADGEVYVDGTFGAGGYSRALLEAAHCTVYAIDRDPSTERLARTLMERFPGRFFWLLGNFGDMCELLAAHGVDKVDGIVLDIGVSSMQIDEGARGFSFMKDGPLDMRMSGQGTSAADIVNSWEEGALADLIYQYGEERKSRAVARAIVKARAEKRIERTGELAQIVRAVVRTSGIDPATRTFQALRIAVNDELGELTRALTSAERLLKSGGRLVVVTFHSLEDRIVKQFFTQRSGDSGEGSRHLPPVAAPARPPVFLLPRKKPVSASADEIRANPRARSAKLRLAIRKEAA